MTPSEDAPVILEPFAGASARPETARARPGGRDPEFDSPPPRTPRRPPLVPQEHQRLVANPFLAFFGLIVWIWVFRLLVNAKNVVPSLLWPACLGGVVYLLQYHCLDCGGTGWLFWWRHHACEAVVARRISGRVRRLRAPNPTSQFVIWLYILFVGAVFIRIVFQVS